MASIIFVSEEDFRYLISVLRKLRNDYRLKGYMTEDILVMISKMEINKRDNVTVFDSDKLEDVILDLQNKHPDRQRTLKLLDEALIRPADDGSDGGDKLPF